MSVPLFLAAKCTKKKNNFLISIKKDYQGWTASYAVKAGKSFEPGTGTQNGKTIETPGGLFVGKGYKCPWCGDMSFVKCNCCGGKLFACYDDSGIHICPHCGSKGEVGGQIESVNTSEE